MLFSFSLLLVFHCPLTFTNLLFFNSAATGPYFLSTHMYSKVTIMQKKVCLPGGRQGPNQAWPTLEHL